MTKTPEERAEDVAYNYFTALSGCKPLSLKKVITQAIVDAETPLKVRIQELVERFGQAIDKSGDLLLKNVFLEKEVKELNAQLAICLELFQIWENRANVAAYSGSSLYLTGIKRRTEKTVSNFPASINQTLDIVKAAKKYVNTRIDMPEESDKEGKLLYKTVKALEGDQS